MKTIFFQITVAVLLLAPAMAHAKPTDLDNYLNDSLKQEKAAQLQYDQTLAEKSQFRPETKQHTTIMVDMNSANAANAIDDTYYPKH